MLRRTLLLGAGTFAASSLACGRPALAQRAKIRIALNPAIYSYLPFFLAIDKGYFKDEDLDIALSTYAGSVVTQLPLAVRGEIDILPTVASPALFNQVSEGFDLRIIASMVEAHQGWSDGTWIMVRKDLADQIKTLADMKGHRVDGIADGSPSSFVLNQALAKAGLKRSDVVYSNRLPAPPDWIAGLKNKAVDVLPAAEPMATQIVVNDFGVRLASTKDIVPWFQESFLVSSAKYIANNRPAVVRFLKGYLRAAKEITEAGPTWKSEYLQTIARWSKIPEDVIRQIPGPSYYGQLGAINVDALARVQDYFAEIGQVRRKVDVSLIIDESAIDDARSRLDAR
jgi:NitT/TauT family transport system substrate-binding protein